MIQLCRMFRVTGDGAIKEIGVKEYADLVLVSEDTDKVTIFGYYDPKDKMICFIQGKATIMLSAVSVEGVLKLQTVESITSEVKE